MMNLERYKQRRRQLLEQEPKYRSVCLQCRQPQFTCYCAHVEPFDPMIQFVILIHPIEVRRRIATGRMSHLCLQRSHLIEGEDYSENSEVNALLNQPDHHSVILYPSARSINLTPLSISERSNILPENKKLTIFVIDGTWNTARKMMRLSQNLHHLPQICFTPQKPSNFRVRKQPDQNYYSTLEAIHHTIDLIGPVAGFDTNLRQHDCLIRVFDHMVERQLEFIEQNHKQNPGLWAGSRHKTPA